MKHHYQTTLLFLLLTTAALAQTFKPVDHWRAGGSGSDVIVDMAFDNSGNQYIVGWFTGTVDVDPGPGVYYLSTPAGYTETDAFLLKVDAGGNLVWAKSFGGTADKFQAAHHVKIDGQGNIYVVGSHDGNVRLEPSGTVWSTASNSSYSTFLAKFNSNGTLIWGYGWYTTSEAFIWNIDFDSNNNLFVGGYFAGTVDFDPLPGAGNVKNRTSNGQIDMFLLKINTSGIIGPVRTAGSIGDDLIAAVVVAQNGAVYLSGSFSGTVDLNFGTGTANFSSTGAKDGFILEIDTALNYQWAKTINGQGDFFCRAMEMKNNTLINIGVFTQSVDLDPSPSSTAPFNSNGNYDCYMLSVDTGGNYLWGQTFGGIGKEEFGRIDISTNSEILISGYFENSVDFDGNPTSDYIVVSKGGRDGFIAQYDSLGSFVSAASFGSNSVPFATESLRAAKYSTNNVPVSCGSFFNTIDINPSTLVTQNVTSAGQDDMLYLKLESCTNALVQSTATACGSSYQLPSGTVVTQSGYYLDTVLSTQGCDSTNGITVTLNPLPNTTVTQTGATFTAQPGLTYQWLNCQTNQPIAGETNQTFTATANGQYAVIVSNGTCTDTSVCYSITNIGLHEAHLPAVSLYPNPTSGMLNISSPQPWQKAEVTDLLGRTVLTQPESKEEVDLTKLPTGIYLVKVFFKEGVVVQRVVKR